MADPTTLVTLRRKLKEIAAIIKLYSSRGVFARRRVLDRLTLIAQPFYENARQDDTAVSTPGTEIGARYGVAEFGPTVISVQGLLHIPFKPGQSPQGRQCLSYLLGRRIEYDSHVRIILAPDDRSEPIDRLLAAKV